MGYKIHYASLGLKGDIPVLEFTTKEQVCAFIISIVYPLKLVNEKVYLIAVQDEVIVTENGLFVQELFDDKLNSVYPFYESEDIFIQEYPSYEDAYEVALDIKEVSPLAARIHPNVNLN